MTANIVVTTGVRNGVLTVPRGAVKRSGKKSYTVMKDGANLVDQSIELGWRDGDSQEVKSGLNDGAKCAVGGGTVGDKGYFVEPTVLTNTNDKMKVIKEEIFGPVVAAEPFEDHEEIMNRSNNSEYGLAAAVWTSDVQKAIRTAESFRAGTVWVNCYNIFDAALPFGGYKQSGWGREMGSEILEAYTQVKSVVIAK